MAPTFMRDKSQKTVEAEDPKADREFIDIMNFKIENLNILDCTF